MTRLEHPEHDVVAIRADNPGPFTLSGTNSWLIGHGPAWLIDPGPALRPHEEAVIVEIELRGGLGGIALTHDHADHVGALPHLRAQFPGCPVAAARFPGDVSLGDGSRFGPLAVIATPGHAPDHLAFVAGDVAFTGDAVLGEGSVFIAPYPGALAGYLAGLERLRARQLRLLCPGHGPAVEDPDRKLMQYVAHRLERERRLIAALERGARTAQQLLDEVWDDVPSQLRGAAGWTLAAHLDKLEQEGRLPDGVQRPEMPERPDS